MRVRTHPIKPIKKNDVAVAGRRVFFNGTEVKIPKDPGT